MSADAIQSFVTFVNQLQQGIEVDFPADPDRMVTVPVKVLTAALDLVDIYRLQAEKLDTAFPNDPFMKFANTMGELGVRGLERGIKKYLDNPAA